MDLFGQDPTVAASRKQTLAARLRPRSLEEILGQEHILGPGKLLRRAVEADRLNSIILYGPPGCGKTSLAEVIARVTRHRFERTSGATANVAVLRQLLGAAQMRRTTDDEETILFIDEIHRFNKAQQDVLLHDVEDGTVTLIGATTHNPMFFINTPLVSRSLIFELRPLPDEAIKALVQHAVDSEHGLGSMKIRVNDEAIAHLALVSEGDARRVLNALEIAALTTKPDKKGVVVIDRQVIEASVQKKAIVYDHDEDGHYDTISAFIKSVRGSDPNAAVYWLAKMLTAGEDPRFIARRLVILASEDIGNADPRGLNVAVSAMKAAEFVGMPEARIILAQATTYLATAPKSNASYLAIDKAMTDIKEGRVLEVPRRLKNKKLRTADRPSENPSDEYVYPHAEKGHFVDQDYVPTSNVYYEPDGQGYEDIIQKRMARWSALRKGDAREDAGLKGVAE